jgi:hypothetical protein
VLILAFFSRFPICDKQTLLLEWDRSSLSSDRSSFSQLMAICALSLSHIKDGAVLKSQGETCAANVPTTELSIFIEEAEQSIPSDIRGPETFAYLPTIASLVLVAFQTKHSSLHHHFLGLYHRLLAEQNLHEESNWPASLTDSQRQTYRHIFWSMYRLEVHSALVMGHVIRCPEQQTMVKYPGNGFEGSQLSGTSWLIGWNFVTDLYRTLEHVITSYRARRAGRKISDCYSSSLLPRQSPVLDTEMIMSDL